MNIKGLMLKVSKGELRLDVLRVRPFRKFLKLFQNKNRRLNLTLLLLFFLTFPNQNYYQSLQPTGERPLVREISFDLPLVFRYPFNETGVKPPFLTARAALVVDVSSKTVIFAKNPDLSLYPASTTKIMTALVALDSYEPEDVLRVKTVLKIGQVIGLKQAERLTFESLFYGLLVGSGNDAAYAIAENYPQGISAFIKKMNEKGKDLHLKETNFVNVTGVEAYNHKTTVHDLAILSAEAIKNPLFLKAVSTKEIEITDIDGEESHFLENTNKLIGNVFGVKGVKTGWTEHAGECLVTYVKRNKGEILTVVLGSQDRFGETVKLIDWVYQNFSWQSIDTSYQQLPGQSQ